MNNDKLDYALYQIREIIDSDKSDCIEFYFGKPYELHTDTIGEFIVSSDTDTMPDSRFAEVKAQIEERVEQFEQGRGIYPDIEIQAHYLDKGEYMSSVEANSCTTPDEIEADTITVVKIYIH